MATSDWSKGPETREDDVAEALPPMRTRYAPQDWPCMDMGRVRPVPPGATREEVYCVHCRSRTCAWERRDLTAPYASDPYPGVKDWVPVSIVQRLVRVGRTAISQRVVRGSLIGVIAGNAGALFVSLGQVLTTWPSVAIGGGASKRVSYEEAARWCAEQGRKAPPVAGEGDQCQAR